MKRREHSECWQVVLCCSRLVPVCFRARSRSHALAHPLASRATWERARLRERQARHPIQSGTLCPTHLITEASRRPATPPGRRCQLTTLSGACRYLRGCTGSPPNRLLRAIPVDVSTPRDTIRIKQPSVATPEC